MNHIKELPWSLWVGPKNPVYRVSKRRCQAKLRNQRRSALAAATLGV